MPSETEDDEILCFKCKETISENDSVYHCDVCMNVLHKSCSELQPSEVKCMPLQKRTLVFLCTNCKDIVRKLPSMVKVLEEVREDLRFLKANNTNGQFPNEADKALPQKSYSEVLKLNKVNPVVVIKPKREQASLDTKKEIRRKIDPSGLNISKFRQAKSGAVVIGCESKQNIDDLKSQLANNLNKDEYTVEIPQLKKPKLRIMNVNKEDIGLDDSDQDIIDEIISSNSLAKAKNVYLKILKKSENQRKNINLIIEADPKTHSLLLKQERIKIGWSRCFVYNHISILQCYKCLGFGHFAKDCKSGKVCSKCSGSHSFKDCNVNTLTCVNCKNTLKGKNGSRNINHSALDKECPCFLRLAEIQSCKTEYFL